MTRSLQTAGSRPLTLAACLLASTALTAPAASAQSITSWGRDTFDQVGNSPTTHEFTQVACGAAHTVALRQDGTLATWGYDGFGQVSGLPAGGGFVHVAAGENHSLALRTDGSIVSWGSDVLGEVSDTPTGTGFVQLAGGPYFSFALHADGWIAAWGSDWNQVVSNTPGDSDFVQVSSSGQWHAVGLKENGSIVTWGTENTGNISETPTGTGYLEVAAGGTTHSLALRPDGSIEVWGFTPTPPPAGTGFVQIAASATGGAALDADGALTVWGDDYYGQVTMAPTAPGFTQVSTGGGHHAALGGALPATRYCTAGTSALGCTPLLYASGVPSASASKGLMVFAVETPGEKDGLFFFGTNGRQANAWGNGSSFQCVVPPVRRTGLLTGNGAFNSCSGWFARDLNAHWSAKPSHNPGQGAVVQVQLWYRDPANTSNQTTSLSDALELTVGP